MANKKIDLAALKNDYKIRREDAASFMLMLSQLSEGDEFKTILGTIKKTGKNTFSIRIGKETVEELLNEVMYVHENPDDLLFS